MANSFKVSLSGFVELSAALARIPEKLEAEIDREIKASAETIVSNAQRDVPVDEGELRRSITYYSVGIMDYEIAAQTMYAAFMEWGTKSKVRVPPQYADLAAQYKQKGGTFKELFIAILRWVHRKGIAGRFSVKTKRRLGSKVNQFAEDYSLAWVIAIKIATEGVEPHPFFFHNFDFEKPKLIARLLTVLQTKVMIIPPGQFVSASKITTI